MKRSVSLPLMFIIATFVMAPGWAQAGSGFYLSSDIGLNIASGIDTTGVSNDDASVCDEYINPLWNTIPDCTMPALPRGEGDDWNNNFDRATGILAGAAVGYSFASQNPNSPLGGFRVELEYFYRQSNYDETSKIHGFDECPYTGPNVSIEKGCRELRIATDRIGSMTSHNLFGNLYYDFANTSRFTPYIGIGGGIGITDMEYGSVWQRNHDAAGISTGEEYPNAAEIQDNLAGTGSFEDVTLSDTLLGLQILFGVDYAVTDAMSLGLKGRWVRFNSFDSGSDTLVWDPLRGHPPNLRLDESQPVSGGIRTNNIEFFGISLNLKYHF